MSQINTEVIKDLQKLCRLQLSKEEEKVLQERLEAIVLHMSKLGALDTKDTPPCIRVQKNLQKTTLRDDIVKGHISKEDFIKNSPKHIGGMIQVPVVIEKGKDQ